MSEQDLERQITFFSGSAEKMQQLIEIARVLGGFAVTQLRQMDSEFVQLSEEERARQERFDTGMESYLLSVMQHPSLLVNRLASKGINTARDLFVLGRGNRMNHGAVSLTSDQPDRIIRALQINFPDETLHETPTASDIAGICFNLDQVHAGVLPTYGWYVRKNGFRGFKAMLRVGAILDEEGRDWGKFAPSAVLPPDVLETCREEAALFAYEFGEAQRALPISSPDRDR